MEFSVGTATRTRSIGSRQPRADQSPPRKWLIAYFSTGYLQSSEATVPPCVRLYSVTILSCLFPKRKPDTSRLRFYNTSGVFCRRMSPYDFGVGRSTRILLE